MRISDWSSDVCSSDLVAVEPQVEHGDDLVRARAGIDLTIGTGLDLAADRGFEPGEHLWADDRRARRLRFAVRRLIGDAFQEIIPQPRAVRAIAGRSAVAAGRIGGRGLLGGRRRLALGRGALGTVDRKSTRMNSS